MKFQHQYPKKYDVSLVGTYHPLREKYLKALNGLDVRVWGWGPWKTSSVAKMYQGKALNQKQLLEVYKRTKVVVNMGRAIKSTIPTDLRPFEAAQVGAFIIINCKPHLNKAFKINKEIICFNSPKEFRDKVKYFLNHPTKRKQIAKAMYLRVKKDHTYEVRFRNLFNNLKKKGL